VRRWARGYAFDGADAAAKLVLVPMTKTIAVRGAAALFLHEAGRRATAPGGAPGG